MHSKHLVPNWNALHFRLVRLDGLLECLNRMWKSIQEQRNAKCVRHLLFPTDIFSPLLYFPFSKDCEADNNLTISAHPDEAPGGTLSSQVVLEPLLP